MQIRLVIRAAPPNERDGRDSAPYLLSQERRVDVRPMNVGVAACARRNLRRTLSHSCDRVRRNRAVALVAERIGARHVQ